MSTVIYARVSTEEQAENQNIQAQLEFLREHVKRSKEELTEEYIDDGVSGSIPLHERADGARLLNDIRQGRVKKVLVLRSDRVGRNTLDTLKVVEEFTKYNVNLKSATENFDTTTDEGMFQLEILASIASRERKIILERTRLGRDSKAKNGQWMGGVIPLGYDVIDKKLVITDRSVPQLQISEPEFVKLLYKKLIDGQSTGQICKWLNALGIPSYKRYSTENLIDCGAKWRTSRLHRLLTNKVYMGIGSVSSKGGEIEYPVPPIISSHTFAQAQAKLRGNRQYKRPSKYIYLLAQKIKCGTCGRYFTGNSTINPMGKKYNYYRCTRRTDLYPDECPSKVISASRLENLVWAEVKSIALNPGPYLTKLQEEADKLLDEETSIKPKIEILRKEIAAKKKELSNVQIGFERGLRTIESALERKNEITGEITILLGEVAQLENQHELWETFKWKKKNIETFLMECKNNLDEIEKTDNREEKKKIIQTLVKELIVTEDGIQAEYIIDAESEVGLFGSRKMSWIVLEQDVCADSPRISRML